MPLVFWFACQTLLASPLLLVDMEKRPAFQFYPKDLLSDRKVVVMSNEQIGGYLKLLCYMWLEDDCCLNDDIDELQALSNLGATTLQPVLQCFVKNGSKITHKRLQAERQKQDEWREKSRLGGLASAKKRAKGGLRVVQPKGNTSSSTPSSNNTNKLVLEAEPQKPEFGNENINKMLKAIMMKVELEDFKESKKQQVCRDRRGCLEYPRDQSDVRQEATEEDTRLDSTRIIYHLTNKLMEENKDKTELDMASKYSSQERLRAEQFFEAIYNPPTND